ncbi:MAG: bifunctional folylpolyglutamate synthase/dihydrofolate synthase [Deltaproteobacteria bacterium]
MKKMTTRNEYEACLAEMFSLRRFGIKLGLGTIRRLLKGLGNPQKRFSAVHIAGTNGKGSIASGIASILTAAEYRVGLYTSPHLVSFNERIKINGSPISNRRVVAAYKAVQAVYHGKREPTFFEFATAMALFEFAEQRVDWGIIETGMGGRLDATNIIRPAICVISNISLEHKFYLGNTITEIAAEKGGIIKKHTPVITGVRGKQAIDTLEAIAKNNSAPLFRLGKDFRVRRKPTGGFDYFGLDTHWKNLSTSLLGPHQVDNAAISLAVCEVLKRQGAIIPEAPLRKGLGAIQWPGRLEIVNDAPKIILDGAHNLMAARNLARYLAAEMSETPITLVLGILDDKPYRAMLQSLVPLCRRLIVTRPVIDRALPPEQLFETAKSLTENIAMAPDVDTAVRTALSSAAPTEVICIAGSLYVVGEAKETLAHMGIKGLADVEK